MLNEKKRTRTILIYAGALFLAAGTLGAVVWPSVETALRNTLEFQPARIKPEAKPTTIAGLAPGSKITAFVLSANGTNDFVQKVASEEGKVSLPWLDLSQSKPGEKLIYNIEFQNPARRDKQLKLALAVNRETRQMSLTGAGLDSFTEITLDDGRHSMDLKADWAGLIKEMDVLSLDDERDVLPVKLAFQSYNIASDAASGGKLMITVQIWTDSHGIGGEPDGANRCSGEPDSGGEFNPPLSTVIYRDENKRLCEEEMKNNFVTAFYYATLQLTAVMAQHTMIIGTFFDAQLQLEAQREMRRLHAQAHKDYHPSEQVCYVGSFVRSLANSERNAHVNKFAISKILNNRYFATQHDSASEGYSTEVAARLAQFKDTYCDVADNNDGLRIMCDHDGNLSTPASGATNPERINKDIDYPRTLYHRMTLDLDFEDGTLSPDEEDIIALAKNLYWTKAYEIPKPDRLPERPDLYMRLRKIIASQNIAHHSFATLVGMKTASPDNLGAQSGWVYMKSLMRQFGLTDAEIHEMMGQNPSYYAQMDVLTKKMYEHPNFFTNLYDKPVNVERISNALEAVQIMHTRDFFKSNLRREMLFSVLVEQGLAKYVKELNTRSYSFLKEEE